MYVVTEFEGKSVPLDEAAKDPNSYMLQKGYSIVLTRKLGNHPQVVCASFSPGKLGDFALNDIKDWKIKFCKTYPEFEKAEFLVWFPF